MLHRIYSRLRFFFTHLAHNFRRHPPISILFLSKPSPRIINAWNLPYLESVCSHYNCEQSEVDAILWELHILGFCIIMWVNGRGCCRVNNLDWTLMCRGGDQLPPPQRQKDRWNPKRTQPRHNSEQSRSNQAAVLFQETCVSRQSLSKRGTTVRYVKTPTTTT